MPSFLAPIFVRRNFFILKWLFLSSFAYFCPYLVYINFHKFILIFWSNPPETENLSEPWSYYCMDSADQDSSCKMYISFHTTIIFLITYCKMLISVVYLALMIPKPFLWPDIRHFSILINAMTECSIVRVQKDPVFGMVAPETWNIFKKVVTRPKMTSTLCIFSDRYV